MGQNDALREMRANADKARQQLVSVQFSGRDSIKNGHNSLPTRVVDQSNGKTDHSASSTQSQKQLLTHSTTSNGQAQREAHSTGDKSAS